MPRSWGRPFVWTIAIAAAAAAIAVATWATLKATQPTRTRNRLRGQLRSSDPAERANAVRALANGDYGFRPEVEPAVRMLRTDPSPEVRRAAVSVLFRWVWLTDGSPRAEQEVLRSVSDLVAAMSEDADPEVRAWAGLNARDAVELALTKLGGPVVASHKVRGAVEPYLQKALRDPHPDVRRNAEEIQALLSK